MIFDLTEIYILGGSIMNTDPSTSLLPEDELKKLQDEYKKNQDKISELQNSQKDLDTVIKNLSSIIVAFKQATDNYSSIIKSNYQQLNDAKSMINHYLIEAKDNIKEKSDKIDKQISDFDKDLNNEEQA